jgi:hypothetical protein
MSSEQLQLILESLLKQLDDKQNEFDLGYACCLRNVLKLLNRKEEAG